MREVWKQILVMFAVILLFPLVLTLMIQGKQQISFREREEIERYLPFLMARTLKEDSHTETRKAWAVLMRSNLTKALHEGGPGLSDLLEICAADAENAGEDYENYLEQLAQVCRETEGEMVYYEGTVCYCPFFEVSGGVTRDAFENFGENMYPYLILAESRQDEESPDYMTVTYYKKDDFYEKVNHLYSETAAQESAESAAAGSDFTNEENMAQEHIEGESSEPTAVETGIREVDIIVTERDQAGYVKWLTVGGRMIGGEAFRKNMGLASSCFTIETSESQIRIICTGVGHGFGFSRYGADVLAGEGKNYQELIRHYYYGVTISKEE